MPPQQQKSNITSSWYKNPKNWLAIGCLVLIPIPIVGVILMWFIAPWSIKAKRVAAFIFIGLPIMIGLLFYFFVFRSASAPGGAINQAADIKRKVDIENITRSARSYCLEKQQCPSNLNALTQKDFTSYLHSIPTDPNTDNSYLYELLNGNKNCVVKATLSTGEILSRNCIP